MGLLACLLIILLSLSIPIGMEQVMIIILIITLSIHQIIKILPAKRTHYDIFINYRGRDLKLTSLGLYRRLQSLGLQVFLDQSELVGRNIHHHISDAIAVASVHLVFLSPNYAESTFCLDELALIVKSGAIIIPIFHDVEPSEVMCKDKSGGYNKALRAHEETQQYDNKTIQDWKDALSHVANTGGLELKAFNGELENEIVKNVLKFFPNLPVANAFE